MKPLIIYLILILILLGFASRVEAQTNHTASSPVFINHVYYSLRDSLVSLEQIWPGWNPKQKEWVTVGVKEAFIWMGRSPT